MSKINPLICYWRPKDIQPVLDGLDSIPCDKLYLNYFAYPHNYTISRKYFLEHPEYTHYVALPNDLVPTKEIFDKLVKTIEEKDPPVLSGVCNVDMEGNKDKVNVCLKLPAIKYYDPKTGQHRIYKWLAESQRKTLIEKGFEQMEFAFAGFPFMFIRRDIIEKIPFATLPFQVDERPIWEAAGGFGGDLAFCTSCKYHGIPVLVDLTCMMDHLRFYGEMLVGKRQPNIEFINKQGQKTLIHEQSVTYSKV